MIRKSDLAEAINDLDHDLVALSIKVHELDNKVRILNLSMSKKKEKLEKAISKSKSEKAKKQTRDKSGKFTKKK